MQQTQPSSPQRSLSSAPSQQLLAQYPPTAEQETKATLAVRPFTQVRQRLPSWARFGAVAALAGALRRVFAGGWERRDSRLLEAGDVTGRL
ncbi:hypothetical protein E2C01_012501 [Portunus trituberculatus]|uniref:Uncharacterized protein n=1 Tax=Portunus trituberculatus TaxID=210409 RepID=A0A5B7DE95_PORTR|nr:hypothetical protein [Portunus trituberculatus]